MKGTESRKKAHTQNSADFRSDDDKTVVFVLNRTITGTN